MVYIAGAGTAGTAAAVLTALAAAGSPLAAPAFILFAFVTVLGAVTLVIERLAPIGERLLDRFGIRRGPYAATAPAEEGLGPTAVAAAGLPPPTDVAPAESGPGSWQSLVGSQGEEPDQQSVPPAA